MKKLFILIQLMASSLILASHSPSPRFNSSTPKSSPRKSVSDQDLINLQRLVDAVDFMNKYQGFKKVRDKSSQSSSSGRISPKQAQDIVDMRYELDLANKNAKYLENMKNTFKKVSY
jgi:hypothetical protein